MTHRGPFQPLLFCDSVMYGALQWGNKWLTGFPCSNQRRWVQKITPRTACTRCKTAAAALRCA